MPSSPESGDESDFVVQLREEIGQIELTILPDTELAPCATYAQLPTCEGFTFASMKIAVHQFGPCSNRIASASPKSDSDCSTSTSAPTKREKSRVQPGIRISDNRPAKETTGLEENPIS